MICSVRPARSTGLRVRIATRMPFKRRGQRDRRRTHDDSGHREPELAAAAWYAFDADLAAHRLDKLARDGKPETGAAEPARMARIGLDEFVEDLVALLERNADAGVAHFETQETPLGRFHHMSMYPHAALFREL